jgi:hypothetical protein
MKKESKKANKPVFGVKLDGKEQFFRFEVKNINMSPYGVVSAEDAIQRPEVIRDLIAKKTFALAEVDKAEYEAYEKDNQKDAEEAEPEKEVAKPKSKNK